jgi:sugar lactone lactonase YvrE
MAAFSRAFTIRREMTRIATSVRCVAPVEAVLGEGPLYDPRDGKLLFLDIKGERLHRYDPRMATTETFSAPGKVSALGLRRKGGYVCVRKEGFALLEIESGALRFSAVSAPESDKPDNRFNDGKVDPFGGFWAGTMDEKEKDRSGGAWWRLSADGSVSTLEAGYHVTNGPAFDASRGRVYFTDSGRQTVFVARATADGFDEKRVFLQFGPGDGYPDGMDVDRGGNLWIAFWDGAAVRRFSPEGVTLEEIAIPAPRPTSIALVGGKAYVTSARIGLADDAIARYPLSGGLFEIGLERDAGVRADFFEG